MVIRLVVALGGNALYEGTTPTEERNVRLRRTAVELADLVVAGHSIVVTHGNGPQVGERLLDREARVAAGNSGPALPLDVLVAMTQAEIGYRIQRALGRELARRGQPTEVVALVTQVIVAADDPAFAAPSKPVGPRYPQRPDDTHDYTEAADGSWRRVVASPVPRELVEVVSITAMLDGGAVPICAGGGGIPVVAASGHLVGVEAVVDKDATSALLARDLGAEGLLILTDVPNVFIGHGTPQQRPVRELTTGDVQDLLDSDQAASGSMGPKLAALARAAGDGREARLGQLGQAAEVVAGRAGTRVVPGPSSGLLT